MNINDARDGGTQDIFYASPAAVPLPMMDRAAGVYMWDEDGNEYLDASSGPMVSALGHGNSRVIDAMADQARKLDYAYSRVARNRPNLELAARLSALAGIHLPDWSLRGVRRRCGGRSSVKPILQKVCLPILVWKPVASILNATPAIPGKMLKASCRLSSPATMRFGCWSLRPATCRAPWVFFAMPVCRFSPGR